MENIIKPKAMIKTISRQKTADSNISSLCSTSDLNHMKRNSSPMYRSESLLACSFDKIKSFSDIRNLNQFQKVSLILTFSGGFLIFLKFIAFWITQNRFLETILIAGTSCFILFSIYLTSDVLAQKYINYKNKKQKK